VSKALDATPYPDGKLTDAYERDDVAKPVRLASPYVLPLLLMAVM